LLEIGFPYKMSYVFDILNIFSKQLNKRGEGKNK